MDIVLADDHELLRAGFKQILSLLSDEVHVFEAANYTEVLERKYDAAKPSLLLLDLHMPGCGVGGWKEALQRVCELYSPSPVVVCSGTYDADTVRQALSCGARGFLPKVARVTTVLTALKLVIDGEIYVPPAILSGDRDMSLPSMSQSSTPPLNASRLSPIEAEVLTLLVKGKRNAEIAAELDMHVVTVKKTLSRIFRKLGAQNRAGATRIALELDLVGPQS